MRLLLLLACLASYTSAICSREQSREAEQLVANLQAWREGEISKREKTKKKIEINMKREGINKDNNAGRCPLELGRFRTQEALKKVQGRVWKCQGCGKGFRNETFLDEHLELRHQAELLVMPPLREGICAADFCEFLPCEETMRSVSTWDSTRAWRRQADCLAHFHKCYFQDSDPTLFFDFAEQICLKDLLRVREGIEVYAATQKLSWARWFIYSMLDPVLPMFWILIQILTSIMVVLWYWSWWSAREEKRNIRNTTSPDNY